MKRRYGTLPTGEGPFPVVNLALPDASGFQNVSLVLRWTFAHALLGAEGFLDHFDVRLRLRQQRFDILR